MEINEKKVRDFIIKALSCYGEQFDKVLNVKASLESNGVLIQEKGFILCLKNGQDFKIEIEEI